MLGLFFEGLSPWHLLVVFALALLFWGNRLPEVARSLGRAVNEFKKGLRDVGDEIGRDEPEQPADRPQKQLKPPTATEQVPAATQREKEPAVRAEADEPDDTQGAS